MEMSDDEYGHALVEELHGLTEDLIKARSEREASREILQDLQAEHEMLVQQVEQRKRQQEMHLEMDLLRKAADAKKREKVQLLRELAALKRYYLRLHKVAGIEYESAVDEKVLLQSPKDPSYREEGGCEIDDQDDGDESNGTRNGQKRCPSSPTAVRRRRRVQRSRSSRSSSSSEIAVASSVSPRSPRRRIGGGLDAAACTSKKSLMRSAPDLSNWNDQSTDDEHQSKRRGSNDRFPRRGGRRVSARSSQNTHTNKSSRGGSLAPSGLELTRERSNVEDESPRRIRKGTKRTPSTASSDIQDIMTAEVDTGKIDKVRVAVDTGPGRHVSLMESKGGETSSSATVHATLERTTAIDVNVNDDDNRSLSHEDLLDEDSEADDIDETVEQLVWEQNMAPPESPNNLPSYRAHHQTNSQEIVDIRSSNSDLLFLKPERQISPGRLTSYRGEVKTSNAPSFADPMPLPSRGENGSHPRSMFLSLDDFSSDEEGGADLVSGNDSQPIDNACDDYDEVIVVSPQPPSSRAASPNIR